MKSNITIILCLFVIRASAQWQYLPTDIQADWRSVYFINDSVGFVLGNLDENSYILKTENYGTSWEIVMHETTTYYTNS